MRCIYRAKKRKGSQNQKVSLPIFRNVINSEAKGDLQKKSNEIREILEKYNRGHW
jgi:hypothetical protein